jgi:hypothetical protein
MAKRRRYAPRQTLRRRSASRKTEFNPDYSYIKEDLRRIATLAGTFIVLMVALSFFLK